MHPSVLLLYLFAWLLVALTPGPAAMYVMTQAARHGFRRALVGVAGIQLGHFVFFGCVGSGLVALLATATTVFTVLRLLGAAYLCWLGIRVIFSTYRSHRVGETPIAAPAVSSRRLFWQGLAIQMSNPKALLFMSAFLPQFIQPQDSLAHQLAVLLAVTLTVDILVLGAYAYFATRGARSLGGHRITAWLERVFGAVLVLLGIRLLTARR